MNRVLYLIIVFSLISCKTSSTKATDSSYAELVPIYDRILQTLYDWTSSKKVKKDIVEETVQYALGAIKAGRLGITISPDLPEDFYEGAQFAYDPTEKKPRIALSPYVLRSFAKYPTIVLSAMVHEMQHAYCFLTNSADFLRAEHNLLERYLYELDAYHVEAKFILKYLINNPNYQLTRMEILLAKSFKDNSLEEFSAKMLGHDMYLAMAISEEYKKPRSEKEMVNHYQEILDSLLKIEFNGKDTQFNMYLKLMPLYTVNQFLPFGVRYVYYKAHKTPPDYDFDFQSTYPELYKSYLRAGELLSYHRGDFFQVNSALRVRYTKLD